MWFNKYVLWGLLAIGFGLWASPASAACGGTAVHGGTHACYLISGATSWTVSGAWSNTAGGTSCACTPATTDDVVLDGFTSTATVGNAITVNSLDTNLGGDAQGAFTGVLTQSATLTIGGDYFYLNAPMTWTQSGTRFVIFTSTTGSSGTPTQVWPNGVQLGNVNFSGSGGYFELESNLSMNTGSAFAGIALTLGTLDLTTHNPNVTGPGMVASAATTINCGSGTFTLTAYSASQAPWTDTATVSCASAALVWTPASTIVTSQTLGTNGATFSSLTVNGVSGGGEYPYQITGAATFTNFNINSNGFGTRVVLPTGVTYTTTNLTITGTSAAPVSLLSTQGGIFATTLTVTNSPTISWAGISGMTFTNAATANNSFNLGGNTNVTITVPSGGSHIIGG